METIKEISLTISRTFNLGNFESLRLEAGAVMSIANEGSVEAARECALQECRETLRAAYVAHHPKKAEG